MVNALALEADEGRGEQRYASGSGKQLWSGDFRMGEPDINNLISTNNEYIVIRSATRWTETS